MKFLSHQHKGSLYAISSGLCYGLIGYFGVLIIKDGVSIYNMLFWRFLIASIFALLIVSSNFKLLYANTTSSIRVIFYGMSFYSGSAIFYFLASQYLGTGLAMVIFFTYPAFVICFNILYYKTPINKIYYFAFPLLIMGMILLIDKHEFGFDILGLILGVLASFSYACYILASKNTAISPSISTLMVSIGCTITCGLTALAHQTLSLPTTFESWLHITALATICTTLPILLLLQGLKYISPEKASMLSVLEPVFVVIVGIALLGEQISLIQIIGIVTILFGALLTISTKL